MDTSSTLGQKAKTFSDQNAPGGKTAHDAKARQTYSFMSSRRLQLSRQNGYAINAQHDASA
jgi:hypothetical protein